MAHKINSAQRKLRFVAYTTAVSRWMKWQQLRRASRKLIALLLVSGALPVHALDPNALPQNGVDSYGSSTKTVEGANLTINQQTNRLITTWGSYNIGQNASVTYIMPDASAISLNYIQGGASQIYGSLNANGQVFLINPDGVLFGKGAQVNVGGLVASSLNLNQDDFINGNYRFTQGTGNGAGSITNEGNINANGGYVAFLAPTITNNGSIIANSGSIAMLAGDQITLTLANNRLINYKIDQGTYNSLIQNKQLIQADGGMVLIEAKAAGDLASSVVNNTGIIQARTMENQAGVIKLMGDMQVGTVNVDGILDASAPAELNPNGGNGGFIETSAAHVKVADSAKVTTLAENGQNGTWLIDPNDFTIGANDDMTGTAVSSALAGGNFTIQTTSMGSAGGNGDIFVNEAVSWNTNNAFTLNAERNININADITATGASGKLNLLYGQGSATGGTNDNYFIAAGNVINLQAGDNFSTQKGSAGPVINYTVITDLGTAGSMTGTDLQGMNGDLTKNYALGADIDATATSGWNGGLGWDPVGDSWTPFTGNLDGLGHTISNLTINRPGEYNVGLFGFTDGAILQNIRLQGGSVSGAYNVGALAGEINAYLRDAAVRNVVTNMSVILNGSILSNSTNGGGLAGYMAAGNGKTLLVEDSHALGTLTGTGAYSGLNNSGGIVGTAGADVGSNLIMHNVSSSSDVPCLWGSCGGLAGYIWADGNVTIANSHATGAVQWGNQATGTPFEMGGLVGTVVSPNLFITNSYATGNINAVNTANGSTGDYIGGLVGYAYQGITINDSHATGTVNGGDYIGGLVGYMENDSTITNSYATGAVNGADYAGGLVGAADNNVNITNSYATGTVNAARYAGGLVGGMWTSGIINNSYATGNVLTEQSFSTVASAGGLVGDAWDIQVIDSYAEGSVTLKGTGHRNAGGLIGYAGETLVSRSNATGNVMTQLLPSWDYGESLGGLIGYADSVNVSESSASGSIISLGDSSNSIGGFIGYANGTNNIDQSFAYGHIQTSGIGVESIGGLIGFIDGVRTDISNSGAEGDVTGASQTGGLVGGFNAIGNITNSYATGNVIANLDTGNVRYVGGLVGYVWQGTNITNSTASGNVLGSTRADYVGGLVGQFTSTAPGATITFTGNQYTGTSVTGRDYVGGIIGSMTANTTSTLSTMDGYHVTANVSGRDYVGGLIGKNGGDVDNHYRGFDITNSSNTGSVTATGSGASSGSSLIIAGASHIAGSGDFVGGLIGHNYNANITNSWASGDVSATGTYAGGLVGRNDSNLSTNPVISNSYASGNISGRAFVGGLAGETFFTDVSNSHATGNVNGTQNKMINDDRYFGGLVGYSYQGSFTTTYATGNVIGGVQVGGLIGMNDSSTVTLSHAEGNVTGGERVGGFIGENYGLVTDSYARGNVFGVNTTGNGGDMLGDEIGGLVGTASADDIIHTYAVGAVSGNNNVGGLIGRIIGGRSVQESYAENISVTGNNMVGGLVGSNQHSLGKLGIIDSYANSPVTGNDRVGGLVGFNGNPDSPMPATAGLVTRSYASGLVTGNTNVGGLIGEHFGGLNLPVDSYWNTGTTGQATSAGGLGVTGKTTTEMQTLATFANWDIDDAGGTGKVWRIYEGRTAPLLRYFLNPLTITANDAGKTYDGLAYSGGNGVSYTPTPVTDTLNGSPTYTGSSQGAINAGSYIVSVDTSNYNSPQYSGFNRLKQNYDISYADGSLIIDPAPLLVTANNASKTYDGQAYNGGNGVTYSGLVNGETSTVLGGTLSYGGSAQGAIDAGSYAITPDGLTSGNYTISYADGTLNILQKPVMTPVMHQFVQLAASSVSMATVGVSSCDIGQFASGGHDESYQFTAIQNRVWFDVEGFNWYRPFHGNRMSILEAKLDQHGQEDQDLNKMNQQRSGCYLLSAI